MSQFPIIPDGALVEHLQERLTHAEVERDEAQAQVLALREAIPDWPKIAHWLYSILDDIDTASDHAKSDNAKYRETVEKLQRLRGEVGASFDGQNIVWRNPPEEYGLTRLWHPCNPTPLPAQDQCLSSTMPPSPEEIERREFEESMKTVLREPSERDKELAWGIWQAARAALTKEEAR